MIACKKMMCNLVAHDQLQEIWTNVPRPFPSHRVGSEGMKGSRDYCNYVCVYVHVAIGPEAGAGQDTPTTTVLQGCQF